MNKRPAGIIKIMTLMAIAISIVSMGLSFITISRLDKQVLCREMRLVYVGHNFCGKIK